MTVQIINADVLDGLRQLPDESVNMVVTSPPYWGLRDYGVDGQIGLEATPAEFVARMVDVFREVRRVLRSDGVCFVNLGDSYSSGGGDTYSGFNSRWDGTGQNGGKQAKTAKAFKKVNADELPPKNLIGIPWRVALALQADGWWLRGDYIWAKPNHMPESVTDRCTKAHEYVFHLSKSERYFWDQEAIKEQASPDSAVRYAAGYKQFGKGQFTGSPVDERKPKEIKAEKLAHLDGRNKRSVWTIATSPFPEAHFATFPPELPEICIKAGCPKGGTVLDPFGGAGTTGLVADRLQRNAILIELNPEYAAMARRRIDGDRGALLNAMEAAE